MYFIVYYESNSVELLIKTCVVIIIMLLLITGVVQYEVFCVV